MSDYTKQRLDQLKADHEKALAIRKRGFDGDHKQAIAFQDSVYVIPAGRFTKVGVSNSTHLRWKSLRAANPLLEPPLFVSEPLYRAYKTENLVHRRLAAYRVEGAGREWFKCNRYLVVEIVKQVIDDVKDGGYAR